MKREKSIMKVGGMYKATMKVPGMSVSETKMFKSHKDAKKWLDKWTDFKF